MGVYKAPARGQPAVTTERDQLFSFALDGVGAKRRLIRDGVVLDWSWDSRWLLIQDHASACIVRATGGEYKCWKGFTAVSIAPDGAWALVLGPRDGSAPTADPPTGGAGGDEADEGPESPDEESEDDEAVDDPAVTLPKGPLSLYRAKLAGPYSERPVVFEKLVDGPAVWLPAR